MGEKKFCKVWNEGGRFSRLECWYDEAKQFIQCSVESIEAKRFTLIFPSDSLHPKPNVCANDHEHARGCNTLVLSKGRSFVKKFKAPYGGEGEVIMCSLGRTF